MAVSNFRLDPQTIKGVQAVNKVGADKYKAGWVRFGNDKLNINTTSAVGLEKAIGVTARFLIKVQGKVNEILYGKYNTGREATTLLKRLLNKGIINLLGGLASVDFCNVLNYALNQVPDGTPFDPTKPPPVNEPIQRKKWQIQKAAYDVQQFIDDYYRDYLDSNNPESRVGLFILMQQINSIFSSTILSPTEGINDPQLKENFPQLSVASNFLQNALGVFNRYTDVRQIPVSEVQRLIEFVDRVRQYCIIIQGLNNPRNAIGLIDSSLNLNIQKELEDLSKVIINPDVATRVLKSVVKTTNDINTVAQKVLGFINTLQIIIKICILLIRIYNIISSFFLAIPIPNVYTTVGVTTKFADRYRDKLKEKGEKKLIKRLEQISAVLNLAAILCTSLVVAIQNIISRLQVILLNLENCTNKNEGLINEIKDSISTLTNTGNQLQKFLDQYNNQQKQAESRFGNYTIQIVTEQVVDEGINLKRRYGIATDSNKYVVVQTTPTFASLDLIIINEVKVLLVSKGLVSTGLSGIDSEDQITILDAARFLGEDEIDLSNIQLTDTDVETLEEQDDDLGLSTFANNLPGGRALRRRVREKMLKNINSLGGDLKSTDPGGKYSSGLVKQQQSVANKLKIQQLEDKIGVWKKEIALAATQGFVGLAIIKDRTQKIKDAEKKIQQLRQG
jgi:hypothetical protein